MQKTIRFIIGAIIILFILVIIEMIREYHTFCVTNYAVFSEKLNGIHSEKKIVFLSDLHNRVYGKDNEKVITKIKNINPDFILTGGDMLVGKPGESWAAAADLICRLSEFCPVYYANGNHEYRMKIYEEKYGDAYEQYKNTLTDAGVVFLENDTSEVRFDECLIKITGLEIPARYYSKFRKQHLKAGTIENWIGEADPNHYQILLAHNPRYCYAYKNWGADLILSGHLHGGVVRIPGIGGLISTQLELFPKYSGEMRKEGDTYIIVSKGLGTHSVNLRLFNTPEIIVIRLYACIH